MAFWQFETHEPRTVFALSFHNLTHISLHSHAFIKTETYFANINTYFPNVDIHIDIHTFPPTLPNLLLIAAAYLKKIRKNIYFWNQMTFVNLTTLTYDSSWSIEPWRFWCSTTMFPVQNYYYEKQSLTKKVSRSPWYTLKSVPRHPFFH